MSDTSQYANTGRFLMGRLRHAMTVREKELLEALISRTETINGEKYLIERGQFCDFSTMLIDGYMLRTIRDDGVEHIVGMQVPGDFVDMHGFALKRLDHDVVAIGDATVGYVRHEDLKRLVRDEPHLVRLFWFSTLLDAAIHREWIMSANRLRAAGRVAHLLTELWYRLRMVGLGDSRGFDTPLTQIHLSKMCGMSTIHMSRSLRDLREGGAVEFNRGRITILDGEKLKSIGKFNPDYLYGEGGLQVGDALNIDTPESLPPS